MWRPARYSAGLIVALVVGAGIVILPLLFILLAPTSGASGTDESIFTVFSDPVLLRLLGTSLGLALATTLLSTLVSVPIGVGLGLGGGRFFKIATWVHLLPLCLPPYFVALGFAAFAGQNGIAANVMGADAAKLMSELLYSSQGVVLVMVVSLMPLVSLTTAFAVHRIDRTKIEAALLSQTWLTVLWRIILPLATPGIGVGALLVFIMVFGEVGVPGLLRVPVYATTVFSRLADLSFEPELALARSLPPLLLALAALSILVTLDKKGRSTLGVSTTGSDALLPGTGYTLSLITLGAAVTLGIMPIAALSYQSITGYGGGIEAVISANDAMISSLYYSLMAAVVMLSISIPTAWSWSRRPRLGSLAVTPLLLGLLIPSAVLGTGLILMWNHPFTRFIYDSSWIVIIGLTTRYIIVPIRVLKVAFDRIPPRWLEVAELHEPSALKRFFTIVLSGNTDGIWGAMGLAFLVSLRDLDTAILFYPPGGETLPVRAMTLEVNAPPGLTATTAVLQIVITICALIVVRFAFSCRRRP